MKKINNLGQSLIEILIAIALTGVLIPALLTGFIASREGKAQTKERLYAISYHKEMEEAVRSIKEKGWLNIKTNGVYHPEISGSSWILSSGSQIINGFTRSVTISSTQNPSIKEVTYVTSWTEPISNSIETKEYLSRYLGNSLVTQTTTQDFNAGVFDNTRILALGDGAIELKPGAQGSPTYTDEYINPANYNYDSNKIEVSAGYAQLKNLGSSQSGQTTNPGFDQNANNWTFTTYGQHNVGQTGTYQSSGGNPGGYIQINFPTSSNKKAGGYYSQSFITTTANPTSTLSFNWTVTGYQATPTSFHLYAWIDSSGTGTPVNQVWDSGNITGLSPWSGTININTASFITTPGTYYLKVGAYLESGPGNKGPFTLGFDNVLLNWSGTSSNYANDSPSIYPKASFQPETVTSWDSFSAVEILNGGSIRYQLSDDDGVSWKYYSPGPNPKWDPVVGPTDYNDLATVNSKINLFPVTSGKIMVKAFLISDGAQFVRLDSITIGYTGTGGTKSGTFISGSFDLGSEVGFNRIIWTETNTPTTQTQLQVATNNDNSNWNFVGPDGNPGTFFTGGSGEIPLSLVEGRYFKYKVTFTSSSNDLPNVSDVSINYSP